MKEPEFESKQQVYATGLCSLTEGNIAAGAPWEVKQLDSHVQLPCSRLDKV